ncbi:MAG: hypothetical protein K0U52_03675 [Gammaproteobacteria bacterium]|nr:hypothetical protein [Gammaproteobacteria bacterium]
MAEETQRDMLLNFCQIDQELKQKKREFSLQRKPLYAQRKNTLEQLRDALRETDDDCFQLPSTCDDGDPLYVRMETMNQTRSITENMVRQAILNITEDQLRLNNGNLQKTILENLKNSRTERKSVVKISPVVPRLSKRRSTQIPSAPQKIARLATTLETTRKEIDALNTHSQSVTASLSQQHKALHEPLSDLLDSRNTRSLRINGSEGRKFYLKAKLSRTKPDITVKHVKNITTQAISSVFGDADQLGVSDLLAQLDVLADEVMARIDDGRTETISQRLTLDRGREAKKSQ